MHTPSSSTRFRIATVVFLVLALGFYMAAFGAGVLLFGVLGVLCELGFWVSFFRARTKRAGVASGHRG